MDTSKMLRIKRKGILYGLVDNDGQVVFPFKYEQIKPFDIRGHTIIKEYEGKSGVVDIYGNIVVPLKYDKILTLFSEGLARVYNDGKYGCVNDVGEEIIPVVYDSISAWGEYLRGTALVSQKGKYGVVDKNGNVIIKLKYKNELEAIEVNKKIDKSKIQNIIHKKKKELIRDKEIRGIYPCDQVITFPSDYFIIGHFDHGYAIVVYKYKYGLINTKCELIIPTKYDLLTYVYPGVIRACINGKMGLIDEDGDVIAPFIYEYINDHTTVGELLSVCRNRKTGFINLFGQEIIPAIYDIIPNHFVCYYNAEQTHETLDQTFPQYTELIANKIKFNKYTNSYDTLHNSFENRNISYCFHSRLGTLLMLSLKGKIGVLNKKGETIIPFEYDYIGSYDPYYDYLILVGKDGFWGFVDEDFNTVISFSYSKVEVISYRKIKLKKDNYWGFIYFDEIGEFSFSKFIYHEIKELSMGLDLVRKGQKYGIIDEHFHEIMPVIYDAIEDYHDKLKLKINDKWGWAYFDENHHYTLSPFIYEDIEDYTDGLALVKKNGMFGFINENWEEVIPFVYEYAKPFWKEMAVVKINGKYGVINTNNETVIPFEYENLIHYKRNPTIIVALKNNKYGIIDEGNSVIVPFEYTTIKVSLFYTFIEKDGQKGLMFFKGKSVSTVLFDEIRYIKALNPFYIYNYEGKLGLFDRYDGIMSHAIYDEIPEPHFYCNRMAVCRNGKWGYINTNGKEVIKCVYDNNPGPFYPDQPVRVSLDGKEFCIDTKGNMV